MFPPPPQDKTVVILAQPDALLHFLKGKCHLDTDESLLTSLGQISIIKMFIQAFKNPVSLSFETFQFFLSLIFFIIIPGVKNEIFCLFTQKH